MNRNLKANLGICAWLAAGLTLFLMLPLTILVIGGANLNWQTGGPILASVAACLFVISFVLLLLFHLRDERRLHQSYLRVKTHLQTAPDQPAEAFLQHFPETDPALPLQVRQILARFFDVTVEKIAPTNFPPNFPHEPITPRLSTYTQQQLHSLLIKESDAPQQKETTLQKTAFDFEQLLEKMSETDLVETT